MGEGRLMALRREAAATGRGGGMGAGARPAPRPGQKQHGIVRAQSGPVGYEALPEVFKRLTDRPGSEDAGEGGVSIPVNVPQGEFLTRPKSSRSVSEDQAQRIFDRLYENAREQRVRKHVYSEIGRLAMPSPVPNSVAL